MNTPLETTSRYKLQIVFGTVITLGVLYTLENSFLITTVLLSFWWLLFRPWKRSEAIMALIAALFFLGQNYAVLKTGGFSFKQQDILLMPAYEPFMWSFYYLSLKRFIAEQPETVRLGKRAVIGLLLTGVGFSICGNNSQALLLVSSLTTCMLFLMFHERYDLYYALSALLLGFCIELFGVSTGLWAYPEPDILGIPWWFATMWLSVGLLGRRFLIPLAEWLNGRVSRQDPVDTETR